MLHILSLAVGWLLGGLFITALAQNVALRVKNAQLTAKADAAVEQMKQAIRNEKAATDNLEEAREIFKQQLHRPASAFFNDTQVETLAQMLTKLLFKPVTELVHKERHPDEHDPS